MKTKISGVFETNITSARYVTLVAAMLGLVSCGGSGPAAVSGDPADGFVRAPSIDSTVGPAVCELADRAYSCPEGMICIGDVLGNSVGNIVSLTRGRRPDWSLDGQRLVFYRMRGANIDRGEIAVINADGSGETVLAAGAEPAWSADGRHIAYKSPDGIAVMNADGSDASTIVRHNAGMLNRVGSPAWSPYGRQIVFVDRGNHEILSPQIFITNSDGSDVRRLNHDSVVPENDPAWSPDGGRIAFTYDRQLSTVGTRDAAGGPITQVAASQFRKSKPDWSPSGSKIAFSENRCGVHRIRIADSSYTGSVQLIAGAREPAWSPDGSRLAFAGGAPQSSPLPSDLAGATSVYDLENNDSFGSGSRYVFYENEGRFQLQDDNSIWGTVAFHGSYMQDGNLLTFEFDGWSIAGSWSATGQLDGSRLSVKYNGVMLMSDFDDGVYVLRETEQ